MKREDKEEDKNDDDLDGEEMVKEAICNVGNGVGGFGV